MSDTTDNQHDRLWGPETRLPTLTPQNTDRRPPTATTVTAQQRAQQQLAIQQQMLRAAAVRDAQRAEDREVDERDHEPVAVRVQWEHTTRYEADLAVDPWLTDEELLARLDTLPDGDRRVIDVVDGENHLVSVVDLDGDGHIDAYEMSAGLVTDWGDVADGIDERIAESPTWPALNATLIAAARDGYDVAANLPQLAAQSALPAHDPAGELYYRLLSSGAVDVDADSASGAGAQPPPRRDESPSYGADAPRISVSLDLAYRVMDACPDAVPPPPSAAQINGTDPASTGRQREAAERAITRAPEPSRPPTVGR